MRPTADVARREESHRFPIVSGKEPEVALQAATLREAGAVDHMIIGGKVVFATGVVVFATISSILAGGFLPDSWDPWFRDLVTISSVIGALVVIWAKFLRHIAAAAKAFVDGIGHVVELSDAVKGMKDDLSGLRVDLANTIVAHDKDIAEMHKSLVDELEENAKQHADLVTRLERMEHGAS